MRNHPQRQDARGQMTALVALCAALLVVGLVAHEIARHALQALPALLCAAAAAANVRGVRWAAAAIELFWIGIAVLIWLFLLGIAPIANGTYTAVEIAMTVAMVLAGAYGLFSGGRSGDRAGTLIAVALFMAAAAIQTAAMAVSLKPPWTNDAQFCAAYALPLLCSASQR